MTFLEKLKQERPKLAEGFECGCDGCPSDFGYVPLEKENTWCNHGMINCDECWNRQIESETTEKCNSSIKDDLYNFNSEFTVNDLKSGMSIELRNGNRYLLVDFNGRLIAIRENKAEYLDEINIDIVKVYSEPKNGLDNLLYHTIGNTIWTLCKEITRNFKNIKRLL